MIQVVSIVVYKIVVNHKSRDIFQIQDAIRQACIDRKLPASFIQKLDFTVPNAGVFPLGGSQYVVQVPEPFLFIWDDATSKIVTCFQMTVMDYVRFFEARKNADAVAERLARINAELKEKEFLLDEAE